MAAFEYRITIEFIIFSAIFSAGVNQFFVIPIPFRKCTSTLALSWCREKLESNINARQKFKTRKDRHEHERRLVVATCRTGSYRQFTERDRTRWLAGRISENQFQTRIRFVQGCLSFTHQKWVLFTQGFTKLSAQQVRVRSKCHSSTFEVTY